MRHNYIPESLQNLDLRPEDTIEASTAVKQFQRSTGWKVLRAKLESLRAQQIEVLVSADKREHTELAHKAGVVRAIDEFYQIFESIKKQELYEDE